MIPIKPGKLTAPYSGCVVNVGIFVIFSVFLVIHIFSQWARARPSFGMWPLAISSFLTFDTMSSSAVIEDLRPLFEQGSICLAYFYCDFRDPAKRSVRNLISSLLIQLAAQSNQRREVLQQLYSGSGNGAQQANDDSLLQCLKAILSRPAQGTTYLVIDGLNECLSSTPQQPPPDAARLIQILVGLNLKDLRIFATNLHEDAIHNALQPLASQTFSLHETQDHYDDIVNYIKWRIVENRRMKRWRYEDRVSTWEVLAEKAAGA